MVALLFVSQCIYEYNVLNSQYLFQGGIFEWIDTGNAFVFLRCFYQYSSVVVFIKYFIKHLDPTLPQYLTILFTATNNMYLFLKTGQRLSAHSTIYTESAHDYETNVPYFKKQVNERSTLK